MKYIMLTFSLFCMFFLTGCQSNQSMDDLIMVQRDAAGNAINEVSSNLDVATSSKTINESTSETASKVVVEQQKISKIFVTIVNSVTKKPVPGVPIVIPYSSTMFYADQSGIVQVPSSYREFYVPKINGYAGSGSISLDEGQKEVEILLQPDTINSGDKVNYIYGTYSPTSDGGAQITGKVIRNGRPASNLVIVVAQSSLNVKTDENGVFSMQVINESSAYRLYFPEEKNKEYYQVDVFKGHVVNINIII